MGHGRYVKNGIFKGNAVDIGEIVERHGKEIPVAQHGSLWAPRRATGVEYPGDVFWVSICNRDGFIGQKIGVTACAGRYHVVQICELAFTRSHDVDKVRGGKAHLCSDVLQNVGELLRMKSCIHGDGAQPCMPYGEQDFRVFGTIFHRKCDAVSGFEIQSGLEPARQRRDATRKFGVGTIFRNADRYRRMVAVRPRASGEKGSNVHFGPI